MSIALAGLAVATWVRRNPTPPPTDRAAGSPAISAASAEALLVDAEARAAEAGCGEVVEVAPYPDDRDAVHVTSDEMPPLASWPSTPPASGPHEGQTLPAGAYSEPPSILRLIHSLEHGAVVIWFSPDAPQPEVERIVEFFAGSGLGGKVIVAPYDYTDQGPAGQLPGETQAAFVAWHRMRTCERLDIAAAFAFVADYASPTYGGRTYLGEAPEPNVGI